MSDFFWFSDAQWARIALLFSDGQLEEQPFA